MSILQLPVAREFCVGQTRATVEELIRPDPRRREEIVCSRRTGEIVLIDTVAADADRADEHAVAVQPKCSGENGDSIREIRVRHKAGLGRDRGRIAMVANQTGKYLLVSIKRSRRVAVDTGRIIALREKTDA